MALDRYAKKDTGVVAFLTPDNLIIGDPGARAWRTFHLETDPKTNEPAPVDVPFSVIRCDDWSRVKPFGSEAANRPVFLVSRRDAPHKFPTRGVRWERAAKGTGLKSVWSETKHQLERTEGGYIPADPDVPPSAWSFQVPGQEYAKGGRNSFAFGMGVNTRGGAGIYHLALSHPNVSKGTVKIRNLPKDGRKSSVVEHYGYVETDLIHPFFRGQDIDKWQVRTSGYMLIPQDPERFQHSLSETAMEARYPQTLRWLRKHKTPLKSRSTPNSSWNMERDWFRVEGPFSHLPTDYAVVVTEQRLPPHAAVLEISRYDKSLGRKCLPLPNHKVAICVLPTREEAIYLCGVLNAFPVQNFISSFGSSTAVSPTTLSRVCIPDWDPADAAHQRVVEVGVSILSASDVPSAVQRLQPDLDGAVRRVLSIPPVSEHR